MNIYCFPAEYLLTQMFICLRPLFVCERIPEEYVREDTDA